MPNIRPFEEKDQNQVMRLFYQLTGEQCVFEVDEMISDGNCRAIVAENENGSVAGFASLVIFRTPVHGRIGRIEGVIVDEPYRGRGIGRMLMDELLKIAKTEKIKSIELTSNPTRIAARAMYESLGFKIKETDIFELKL